LAEKRLAKVNWCPNDQTVLANEQTVSESGEKGVCVRCGAKVVQKDLEQWFFKITDFADALVDDLDQVDWPESTKINQRNWIGRNHGVKYSLPVKDTDLKVETYSTHFEAFWADTFAVIAPDHPRLAEIIGDVPEKNEILARAQEIVNIRERAGYGVELAPEGVFTGRYLVDPITNTELPLWVANYALADYGTGIVKCSAHDQRDFAFAKKYQLPLRVVLLPDNESLREAVQTQQQCFSEFEHATLMFPEEFAGKRPTKERENILNYLIEKGYGTKSTQYRLRDWLVSRQRYWGAPIPVVYDPQGVAHAVPEEHLPWLLPTDVEFRPTGTSPLGQSKELLERTERIFGKGWRPEIDTMDTFVCSSWYYFRFGDPRNTKEFASKESIAKWQPVDLYMGGAEHTVLHLMYARFITKALERHGYVQFSEPFKKLRHQGTILAEDGSKMSKSKGNVINPDEVVATFGADTLRLYEMFMGPLEANEPWSTNNIVGVRRFLERVWFLHTKVADTKAEPKTESLLQQTIQKVTEDLETLKMNTAISALMILSNHLSELDVVPKATYATLVQLLAPLAPHIAEELWEQISTGTLRESWPVFDAGKIVVGEVNVAVQINGKVRGTVALAPDTPKDAALEVARAEASVAKWLAAGREVQAIYVPGKIINFVVQDTEPQNGGI
jgi:leucyl-tRNA synthetase